MLVSPLAIEKAGYQTLYLSLSGKRILHMSISASSRYGQMMRSRSFLFFSTTHTAYSQGVLTQSLKKIFGKLGYKQVRLLWNVLFDRAYPPTSIVRIDSSHRQIESPNAYAQYRCPHRTQGTSSKNWSPPPRSWTHSTSCNCFGTIR